MRVLHIVHSIGKRNGGVAMAVQGLVGALAEAGVEVALASCVAGEEPWLTTIPYFYAPRARQSVKNFLAQIVDEFQPDVIHIHNGWLLSMHGAAVVARQKKIPYVFSPHSMLEPWTLQQKKWKKRLALWLYQRKDLQRAVAIHATAPQEADHIRALGFTNPIAVIPNGITTPQIATAPAVPRNDDSNHTVLFLSRMHLKKGVLELVEAWAQVKPKGWVCELVYSVSGREERAYEARVKARVAELGLTEQFVFTGALFGDDKWAAYARADLFVLPTYSENFGIVVAEALAAGVPVITTKGAPWAALEAQRCGRWIEVGGAPLATALRELMALSPAERAAMGARGRLFVLAHYQWPALAEQMKKWYNTLK